MKGGTLCTKFALAGFGLSCPIISCKQWNIHDEVCGLTKKKEKKTSHCNSRALFTRKAPIKKTLWLFVTRSHMSKINTQTTFPIRIRMLKYERVYPFRQTEFL